MRCGQQCLYSLIKGQQYILVFQGTPIVGVTRSQCIWRNFSNDIYCVCVYTGTIRMELIYWYILYFSWYRSKEKKYGDAPNLFHAFNAHISIQYEQKNEVYTQFWLPSASHKYIGQTLHLYFYFGSKLICKKMSWSAEFVLAVVAERESQILILSRLLLLKRYN